MWSALFAAVVAVQSPANSVELPFRTIGFGNNGKIKDGGAVVIRSERAFDAYRKQMSTASGRKPVVNWSKDQVVAVHAVGVGFGGSSLHVSKVRRKANALEVEAYLERGSQPPLPTPGVVQVLKKEGIFALIVVANSRSEVTLKVVDPP